jgi:ribose transport system substrate-binding protein
MKTMSSATRIVIAGFLSILLYAHSALAADCIGVISAGGGNSFWSEVKAGAIKAGGELGVEIYFRGPTDEAHPDIQRALLRVVAEKHCKAVVLAPSAVERAQDVAWLKTQGIPTVYIDRDPGGADVAAVVSTNNFLAGKQAGLEMAKALNHRGRVMVFCMDPAVNSTSLREAGFIEAARQEGLLIVDKICVGSEVGKARELSRQAMLKYNGRVDGVFTPNESTSTAVVMTLRQLGLSGKTRHIGFDSSAFLLGALGQGHLFGLMVQHPFDMGYKGVYLARKAGARIAIVPHSHDTGVLFLNQARLPQFLLGHPPEH